MRLFGLWWHLHASPLLFDVACGWNLVCESCLQYAPVVHEILSNSSSVDGLYTVSAEALRQTLAWRLEADAITDQDVVEKCQRFLAADRHILVRLWKGSRGKKLALHQVLEELCVQRLRCPLKDLREPGRPSIAQNGKPSHEPAADLESSGSTSTSRTAYADLLSAHQAVAGSWEASEATCHGASCKADLEVVQDGTSSKVGDTGWEVPETPADPLNPSCLVRKDSYKDLQAVNVVVVVFSGRRDRMRILMRYLRRDLRKHGGVVDKIVFALWQYTAKDLSYLKELVSSSDGADGTFDIQDFSEQRWGRSRIDADPISNRMVQLYKSMNETDTVYVKVDDDVVYIAEHAIAELVRERLRKRCLLVSANVVNHAIMSALHQDRGAHRGFWPTEEQQRNPVLRLPWSKKEEINMSPNFQIERFPASRCVVERWDCAALVHESFLDRSADNTLCAFDFGWHDFNRLGYREHRYIHRSPSVNKEYWTQGARHGKGDDEEEFTGPHSERRDRHSCAVGAALVVHFSYGSQEEGLMAYTNLLKRYDKLSRRIWKASKPDAPDASRFKVAKSEATPACTLLQLPAGVSSLRLQLAAACFLMKPWLCHEYRGRWLVLAVCVTVLLWFRGRISRSEHDSWDTYEQATHEWLHPFRATRGTALVQSVVRVRAFDAFRPWSRSHGSGFLWDRNGHIVTNFHVVQHASFVSVHFADGLQCRAKVKARCEPCDLAVLQVLLDSCSGAGMPLPPPLRLARHGPDLGAKVAAVGHPEHWAWLLGVGHVTGIGRRSSRAVQRFREGTAEAFLSELEAIVFGEGDGATLFTCVPVSENARASANLSDGSAIRGSGDRRGLVVPALRSSLLIESRQEAANAAVLAAVPWASAESRNVANHCLETWLAECGNEPSNPKQKSRTGGVATASLHELLPQALAAIRAQLPVFNSNSDGSSSLPPSLAVAIVRALHWLMQQSDYLVLKDRLGLALPLILQVLDQTSDAVVRLIAWDAVHLMLDRALATEVQNFRPPLQHVLETCSPLFLDEEVACLAVAPFCASSVLFLLKAFSLDKLDRSKSLDSLLRYGSLHCKPNSRAFALFLEFGLLPLLAREAWLVAPHLREIAELLLQSCEGGNALEVLLAWHALLLLFGEELQGRVMRYFQDILLRMAFTYLTFFASGPPEGSGNFLSPVTAAMTAAEWTEVSCRREELDVVLRDAARLLAEADEPGGDLLTRSLTEMTASASLPALQDFQERCSVDGVVFASVAAGHGSSGGPLLDSHGDVTGVITWQFSGSQPVVIAAISTSVIRQVVPQLISRGSCSLPHAGIEGRMGPARLTAPSWRNNAYLGVKADGVRLWGLPSREARDAGLRWLDEIVAVGRADEPVRSVADVLHAIQAQPGLPMPVRFRRFGSEHTAELACNVPRKRSPRLIRRMASAGARGLIVLRVLRNYRRLLLALQKDAVSFQASLETFREPGAFNESAVPEAASQLVFALVQWVLASDPLRNVCLPARINSKCAVTGDMKKKIWKPTSSFRICQTKCNSEAVETSSCCVHSAKTGQCQMIFGGNATVPAEPQDRSRAALCRPFPVARVAAELGKLVNFVSRVLLDE
eukprot:s470_g12.t2